MGYKGEGHPPPNDTTSLGDWHIVNANKFPEGLRPVAEALQGMGLAFGLWVEPECVSEESSPGCSGTAIKFASMTCGLSGVIGAVGPVALRTSHRCFH